MEIRLIGLGQCGSRITYDFFAFLSNKTPSNEINMTLRNVKDLNSNRDVLKLVDKKENILKRFITKLGWKKDKNFEWLPKYIIGDLNPDNQIFSLVAKMNENNQNTENENTENKDKNEPTFFEGALLDLGERSGGCGNYQIIGQTIMDKFLNMNNQASNSVGKTSCTEVAVSKNEDLTIFAYSAGGGTGSGTCSVLSEKVYETYDDIEITDNQKAVLNVVIMPEREDASYEGQNTPLQITAGRTVCLLQNNRYNLLKYEKSEDIPNKIFSNGNMLMSNSIAANDKNDFKKVINNMNLYISSNILEIIQASSKSWSVNDTDITQIKRDYGGASFISCYAESQNPDLTSEERMIELFSKSIDSFKETQSGINKDYNTGCGASVLLDDRIDVRELLKKDFEKLDHKEENFTEFRTASKVVFYLGVPVKTDPTNTVNQTLGKLAKYLFPNASAIFYLYYHVSSNVSLTIHVIDSFINETYDLFLRYLDSAWKWKENKSGQDLAALIDSKVIDKHSNNIGEMREFLAKHLKEEKEDYDISVFSDWNKVKSDINDNYLIDIDSIAAALVQFSNQFHWERKRIKYTRR
jgi:hypothetical protein